MATDNKKVSGYLPQYIFDLFEDFREKRSLSASSALITILSEYFQVDQKVDYQTSLLSSNDFVSREQFEALENKLGELNSSLLSELDRLDRQFDEKFNSLRGELLSSPSQSIEFQTVNLGSEQQEDTNHLQLDLMNVIKNEEDLNVGESTFESNVLSSIDISLTITSSLLRKRLGLPSGSSNISKNKKRMPEDKFYSWLQNSDPDHISWKPLSGNLQDVTEGWIPDKDTSSELLSRLKKWITNNFE